MAGGEPRLGTTATYMRHNDHGTTLLSTEIDILHDLINNEYRVFSAGSVRKWSKFGLEGDGFELSVPHERGHRFELSFFVFVPEAARVLSQRTTWVGPGVSKARVPPADGANSRSLKTP